jgi:7-carboxy-7-deazaguanine synthase
METFGPTVQGEGMVIGQKTMFVRMAGCDYSCSWCDSAFTWDGSGKQDIRMLSAADIFDELRSLGGDAFSHVTLSGGNPALLPNLHELIRLLQQHSMKVALETQGSKWQSWFLLIDELTLSPKPPSSGMTTDWSMLDTVVHNLADEERNVSIKVVVFDEEDLRYAVAVRQRYPEIPFFVQAGNDDIAEPDPTKLLPRLIARYHWLVDNVMASSELIDVRVLPQLHAWLWGNKRGV